MEQDDKEVLRHISETLDEVLLVLKAPSNRFLKGIEIAGAIVSIFAIIGIIDIIRNWILGGRNVVSINSLHIFVDSGNLTYFNCPLYQTASISLKQTLLSC